MTAVHPIRTTSATTLIPAPPPQVWRAVEDLAGRLWNARALTAEPDRLLILALSDDPDSGAQCWLTWTLTAASVGATRVDISCSEEADCAPPPELDALLLLLLARTTPQSSTLA